MSNEMTWRRGLITLVIVTAILHLIWEFSHVSLYTGYEHINPLPLPIAVWATIGDVFYTVLAVLLVALFKGRLDWFTQLTKADLLGLAIIGFFGAVLIEYKALTLGRWAYLESMPLIAGLKVGLSPVLQMTLLLPFSVWLTSRFWQRQG